MSAIEKLANKSIQRLETENLINFSKSLSDEMAQTDQVSEQDRRFVEAFQSVHSALKRVEEKTLQLGASAATRNIDDETDAKERLVQLYSSLDRMQTAAFFNPVLQPFSNRVVALAREMSQQLSATLEKDLRTEFENLYDQFRSI